ncbi:MAG TPA: hypothetical protein VEC60_01215 [Reyranella sp.]|nr:hypothetical protein [Reyranella sp.]
MFEDIPAEVVGVGIPWYRRGDYRRIREVMADPEFLPGSFDQWLRRAEQAERQLRREGRRPYRARIDAEEFVAWCAERGLDVDGRARQAFAANPAHWDVGHEH